MKMTKDSIWTKDFTLVWLVALTTMFAYHLLLPTLPRFVLKIGGGTPQVGLSLAVFSMAALATRILGGWMVDRYGQKLPLLIGASLFVVTAPLYGMATGIWVFFALRALHGFAFGFLTNATYSIVADLAPPTRRGEALGHITNASTVSSAIAPATAAALLGLTGFILSGFQMVFALCAVAAVAGFVASMLVHETRTVHVATKRGLASVLNWEAIPLAKVSALVQFAAGGVLSFVPLYLADSVLPVFYLCFAAALIVARPLIGRLSDRIDRRRLVPPLLLTAAAGVGLLASGQGLPVAVAAAILFGIGYGAFMPVATAIIVDRTPPEQRGTALATFISSIDIGIAAGSTVLGYVAVSFGLSAVFIGASISIVLGLLLFVFLQARLAPLQVKH
jgi:MFS family permease